MKKKLYAGTTSHIERVFLQDTTQTDGRGLTGLAYNSAGLTVYYIRQGEASATAISLVTATVGTWVSGGFKEIDATNMPGWYELHVPNAAIAAGAKSVGIHLKGATNMAPYPIELELDAVNYQDAAALGLSRLDANTGDAATPAEVLTQAAAALTTYDPPTRTEATSDKAEILAGVAAVETDTQNLQSRIPAALEGGRMPAVLAATPPTLAEIRAGITADHGAGAYGPGGGGQYTRTITVRDADTAAPIRDALVTIRDAADTGLVQQARTNAAGQVVMTLDADTYARTISALGYTSESAAEFIVPAANGTTTVELTALAVSPPSSAEFVTLYGDLFLDATAQEDATITAEIAEEDLPALLGSYGLNSGAERTATADASGRWELELQRGIRYRITAAAYGLRDYPLTMPEDVETVTLASFLD